MEELQILTGLKIQGRLSIVPTIIPINWNPPLLGWIKVNMARASLGSLGPTGCHYNKKGV